MEWIEKHSVFIMLIIAFLGWFAQLITSRYQVKQLIEWQKVADKRLNSIDNEINQIKVSDARESLRTNLLTEDIAHMRRSLDDLREMFIMALSSGTIRLNPGVKE